MKRKSAGKSPKHGGSSTSVPSSGASFGPKRSSSSRPGGFSGGRPGGRAGGRPGGSSGAPRPGSGRPNARPGQREPSREKALLAEGRWVIGVHSCEETLKIRPKKIVKAFLRADGERATHLHDLKSALDRARVTIESKSLEQLDAFGSGHQGIAVCVSETPEVDWARLESQPSSVVLVLDSLEDPQNLGSILRTAWLAGVSAILLPTDRAVGLTPTVCKIASGGAEHVPLEAHASLLTPMQRLKDMGFWIYGLSEKGSVKPWDLKLPGKTAWVVGSEGSGLRTNVERACDELVRLPQASSGSSYNASVAAAMALMETCRQLGSPV